MFQILKIMDLKFQETTLGLYVFLPQPQRLKMEEIKSGQIMIGSTQIHTSISSIIALLNDRETYPEWVYRCGKSMLVKKISDSEGIYYQSVLAPWPVDNRDFVVDVKVVQDSKTKVVTQFSNNLPNFFPLVSNHVRITEFKASWTFTPLKNGMVNCEYELLVNPGGNVPAFLVNMAAIDGPYETTTNLRNRVMDKKYQKASFSFIHETN